MSQQEFNALARRLPVLVNMRPFGEYSMVDIDDKGGLQVIVKELSGRWIPRRCRITCTGETLAEQVQRLDPPAPDERSSTASRNRSRTRAGCACCRGNLAPEGGAILKIAGVEGGVTTASSPGEPVSSKANAI